MKILFALLTFFIISFAQSNSCQVNKTICISPPNICLCDNPGWTHSCCPQDNGCQVCQTTQQPFCMPPLSALCYNSWGDCSVYLPNSSFCCNMDVINNAPTCPNGWSCCRSGPYIPESPVFCCPPDLECAPNFYFNSYSCQQKCPPNYYHAGSFGELCCQYVNETEYQNGSNYGCNFNCSAHTDCNSCIAANERLNETYSQWPCSWCSSSLGDSGKCVDGKESTRGGLQCQASCPRNYVKNAKVNQNKSYIHTKTAIEKIENFKSK